MRVDLMADSKVAMWVLPWADSRVERTVWRWVADSADQMDVTMAVCWVANLAEQKAGRSVGRKAVTKDRMRADRWVALSAGHWVRELADSTVAS